MAVGDEATEVLERFARLSEPFGTRIEIAGESARVALS
jgi:hypothetical protein